MFFNRGAFNRPSGGLGASISCTYTITQPIPVNVDSGHHIGLAGGVTGRYVVAIQAGQLTDQYAVLLAQVLTDIYHYCASQSILDRYAIKRNRNITVDIAGDIYPAGRFVNLTIDRPLSMIGSATFDLYDPALTICDSLHEGIPVTVRMGSTPIFWGIVQTADGDRDRRKIDVKVTGLATLLQNSLSRNETFIDRDSAQIMSAALTPDGWSIDLPPEDSRDIGYQVYRAGNLSHLTTIAKANGWDWVATRDIAGNRIYKVWRGATVTPTPAVTFWEDLTAMNHTEIKDLGLSGNAVIAVGAAGNAEHAEVKVYLCTNRLAVTAGSEGYLDTDIDAATTVIRVPGNVDYSLAPGTTFGTILIGQEEIKYTGFSNSTFSGIVRGYNGSTAAKHDKYSPVVRGSDFPIVVANNGEAVPGFGMLDDLPLSGQVNVGGENITFFERQYVTTGSKTVCWLKSITRGFDTWPHRAGVWVRDGSYSPEFPEPGSSIDRYGINEIRIDGCGLSDHGGLEYLAQETLYRIWLDPRRGTFSVMFPHLPPTLSPGDYIRLIGGSRSRIVQVASLRYDQMRHRVDIEYGPPIDYYSEVFNRLDSAVDSIRLTTSAANAPLQMLTRTVSDEVVFSDSVTVDAAPATAKYGAAKFGYSSFR